MRRVLLALAIFLVHALHASAQTDSTSVGTDKHTVTRERMNKGLVTGGLEALSGQSAGVTISTGTNRAAMLSAVRVRGTTSLTGGNDPLVIIDGAISDLSVLSNLYPGDIESFTILKDASETAQYGSRGASGVIKVTTAKGSGDSFTISYDGSMGVESIYKNLHMLSAQDFRSYNNAHGLTFPDLGADSDMPSSIVRNGSVQSHHIAFGSGTGEGRYRAALGLTDHRTLIRTNSYRSYSMKLDVNQKAFSGLLDFNLGVYASILGSSELHDIQHLFYSSAAFNPTFPVTAGEDGSYSQIPASSQINHPVSLLAKKQREENSHFNVHFDAVSHLGPGLTLTAFASYSYNATDNAHFFPTSIWSNGEAYRGWERENDMLGNLTLDWSRTYGEHKFSLKALAEAQQTTSSAVFVTTTGFSTDEFGYHSIQAGSDRPWDGTASSSAMVRMLSFLGGAGWSYGQALSLSATVRADASSKFGPNHRLGIFPSLSGSWTISKRLKVNAGYGLSGNQGGLSPYNSLSLVAPDGTTNYNGTVMTTMGLLRNANPDLRWEVRSSANLGLESTLFGGRLVLTAEYYDSMTRNMLYEYQVSVPPFAYDKLMANLGKMANSGFEAGLAGAIFQQKDMELNLSLNISFQRNRLVSLGGYWQGQYLEAPSIQGINAMNGAGFHGGHNDVVYQIVGQPLGVFYLPHCTGLADNGDGTLAYETDGVNRICGQASPKALLGSNISFRFKDFDLTMQVNGAFGHKIFNGTALTYMNLGSLPYYNVLAEAPAARINDQTVTDYWLEKGDYLNIDYLTLGWNVPTGSLAKSLRLTLSVNNLATLTGYSGLTPILNNSVVNSTFGLDDKISFPVYRTWSMGLNLRF